MQDKTNLNSTIPKVKILIYRNDSKSLKIRIKQKSQKHKKEKQKRIEKKTSIKLIHQRCLNKHRVENGHL